MEDPWGYWVTSSTSTTNAVSGGNFVWNQWVNGTGTSSTGNEVWGTWVGSNITASTSTNGDYVWAQWQQSQLYVFRAPELTDEERKANETRQEEYRKAEAERVRLRDEAEKKAELLLMAHLNDEQRKQMADFAYFIVVLGLKQYRIRKGWAGNVDELNERGEKVAQLCIHPSMPIPVADSMLAQKLMLETAPEAFQRIANRTPAMV